MMQASQFQEIYTRYLSSGLTVKSFCQNEGILESRFYYWQRRIKHLLPGGGVFIPVVMDSPSPFPGEERGGESTSAVTGASRSSISSCQIRFPNGVSLGLKGALDWELIRNLLLLQ